MALGESKRKGISCEAGKCECQNMVDVKQFPGHTRVGFVSILNLYDLRCGFSALKSSRTQSSTLLGNKKIL